MFVVFGERKALLEPVGITRSCTDGCGAYERHGAAEPHTIGKAHTQHIARTHLHWRTRFQRLVRRTSCCAQRERMHALVIGPFIHCEACGRLLCYGINSAETPSSVEV